MGDLLRNLGVAPLPISFFIQKWKNRENILSDRFFLLLRKMVKLKFFEYISLDKSECEWVSIVVQ